MHACMHVHVHGHARMHKMAMRACTCVHACTSHVPLDDQQICPNIYRIKTITSSAQLKMGSGKVFAKCNVWFYVNKLAYNLLPSYFKVIATLDLFPTMVGFPTILKIEFQPYVEIPPTG